MSPSELKSIEDRATKATEGPWLRCVTEPMTVEQMTEWTGKDFQIGTRDIIEGVWIPSHPQSVVGDDPQRPEHAVKACITGNGPSGEANAEFIAAARSDVPKLAEQMRRVAALAINSMVGNQVVKCGICGILWGGKEREHAHPASQCPLAGWSYADAHP